MGPCVSCGFLVARGSAATWNRSFPRGKQHSAVLRGNMQREYAVSCGGNSRFRSRAGTALCELAVSCVETGVRGRARKRRGLNWQFPSGKTVGRGIPSRARKQHDPKSPVSTAPNSSLPSRGEAALPRFAIFLQISAGEPRFHATRGNRCFPRILLSQRARTRCDECAHGLNVPFNDRNPQKTAYSGISSFFLI